MQTKTNSVAVLDSKIEGLKIISAKMVTDNRGTVRELYRKSIYSNYLKIADFSWSQINLTRTNYGAVRGLHGENMSKLVTVAFGSAFAFGVYVDTRNSSKTRGKVVTVSLVPGVQVFVPEGVCNGFQALEDNTEYLYFFDNEWSSEISGVALSPLDGELKIKWPIPIDSNNRGQISLKDVNAPNFRELIRK